MNKPLKDWTLGEIKAECEKRPCVHRPTNDCPFYGVEGCAIKQATEKRTPNNWDLSEPPRWTEQDKEDAKAVRRLIPDAYILCRYSANTFLKLYDRDDNYIMNLNDCFPGLPLGEKVTLYEIIGGTE